MHACVVVGTRGICAVQIVGFFDGSCSSGGEGDYGPLILIGSPVVRKSRCTDLGRRFVLYNPRIFHIIFFLEVIHVYLIDCENFVLYRILFHEYDFFFFKYEYDHPFKCIVSLLQQSNYFIYKLVVILCNAQQNYWKNDLIIFVFFFF